MDEENKKNRKLKILVLLPRLSRFFRLVALFLFIYSIFDVFVKGELLVGGIEMVLAILLYLVFPYFFIQIFFKAILKETKEAASSAAKK